MSLSTRALPAAVLLIAACGGTDAMETAERGSERTAVAAVGATAVLRDAAGAVVGEVAFSRASGAAREAGAAGASGAARSAPVATVVAVELEGLAHAAGHHGFHVHANDDPANGEGCIADPGADPGTWFVAVDGHLAAPGEVHAGHRGDMPSVLVTADGTARAEFVTDRFSVEDLAGTAVVLHAGPDNFGNLPIGPGPDEYSPNGPSALAATARTGNAGDRIACGEVTVEG